MLLRNATRSWALESQADHLGGMSFVVHDPKTTVVKIKNTRKRGIFSWKYLGIFVGSRKLKVALIERQQVARDNNLELTCDHTLCQAKLEANEQPTSYYTSLQHLSCHQTI
jgi:hypothetical protein